MKKKKTVCNKNKTKQNKTKQNKTKQNETKRNETKRNETKQNKTKQRMRFLNRVWNVDDVHDWRDGWEVASFVCLLIRAISSTLLVLRKPPTHPSS